MKFLIENWKESWKWFSVQLAALGAAISGLLIVFPDAVLQALALLPKNLLAELDKYKATIALVLFISAILARLINQKKD